MIVARMTVSMMATVQEKTAMSQDILGGGMAGAGILGPCV